MPLEIFKKWWFWVLVAIIILIIISFLPLWTECGKATCFKVNYWGTFAIYD